MFQSLLNVIENTGMSGCRHVASTQRCDYFLSVVSLCRILPLCFPKHAWLFFLSSMLLIICFSSMFQSMSLFFLPICTYFFLHLIFFFLFLSRSFVPLFSFSISCYLFSSFFPFFLSYFSYSISRSVPAVAFCV